MGNPTWKCPKCKQISGDDWSQCAGKCPVAASPHYDPAMHIAYGNPIPYRKTPQ